MSNVKRTEIVDTKEVVNGENKFKEQIEIAKKNGDFKTAFNLIGRLLNKYKKLLIKVNKKPINQHFTERQKEELVHKLNELIAIYRNELKDAYKNALKKLSGKNNLDENGELRRSYIKYIENEIISLLNKTELNNEEKKYLTLLEKEFPQLIEQYKKNLDIRAKENLSKSGNDLVSTVINLPKGCLLAIKKIEVCIKDVHNAKTNKDKILKIMEVARATIDLLTIPVIYLGKWTLNSIVLITIGSILDLPNDKFKKYIENINLKIKDLVGDIKDGNLGKITPAVATNGKVR